MSLAELSGAALIISDFFLWLKCIPTKNPISDFITEKKSKTGYDKGTRKQKGENAMKVIHVTAENYTQEVLNAQQKVLLDFWAPWCGPCRMLGPVLEEVAAERPDIKVCKINVDEEMALARQFRVMSIPTLVVMENGHEVNKAIGARPKAQILAML